MKGYQGEVMLLRWGDNSTSGRTVTFQLPDDEEEHPFRGLATGKTHGQRFKLYALYEEEAGPGNVFPEEAERKEREKSEGERAIAKMMAMVGDDEFRAWLMGQADWPHPRMPNQGEAVPLLKGLLGIESRKELHTNTEARKALDGILADFEYRNVRR